MQTVQIRKVRFYEIQCDSGEATLNVKKNDADDEISARKCECLFLTKRIKFGSCVKLKISQNISNLHRTPIWNITCHLIGQSINQSQPRKQQQLPVAILRWWYQVKPNEIKIEALKRYILHDPLETYHHYKQHAILYVCLWLISGTKTLQAVQDSFRIRHRGVMQFSTKTTKHQRQQLLHFSCCLLCIVVFDVQ